MRRRVAAVAFGAYVAGVAALTLGPLPDRLFRWSFRSLQRVEAFQGVERIAVERFANVLLFIPLGLLLCLALPRLPRLLGWTACALMSVGVEVYQAGLPDRDASLVDIATNSLGAAIGVLLAGLIARRAERPA